MLDPSTPSPSKPLTPQATNTTATLSNDTTQTQLLHKMEAHSRLLEESNRVLQEHTRVLKACPKPAPSKIQPVAADPHNIHQSYDKAAATSQTPCRPLRSSVQRGSQHCRADNHTNK
ncbi:unnamed protein product [Pieris macdunnoughi]|uniref:Uncharacterized protein n=1 Tax=Pieris macdunnoughi TaxID=345717 RepID=A0A821XLH1_9NEOP|nr:unnamed protein product [Pieris macdunnoughi]